jgi:hypothetical protein
MFCTYQKQKPGIMVEELGKSTPSGPQMYVELNSEQPQDKSLGLLETMRSIKARNYRASKKIMKKLLKASKEQEELNEILLKNMTEMKQNKNVGQTSSNAKKEFSNDESHKHKDHPIISDKTKLLTEGSSEDNSKRSTLQKTIPKTKEKKWHDNKLFGEFKKIRPPNFDGESEEGVEAWLLNMENIFKSITTQEI